MLQSFTSLDYTGTFDELEIEDIFCFLALLLLWISSLEQQLNVCNA
jgi:hypothetical protein